MVMKPKNPKWQIECSCTQFKLLYFSTW